MGNYLDANGLGKYTQLIKNGYMPGATVGSAEQITTDVGAIDKVPYNFRTSGGSIDIGDRERDKIVGGTIAWNQLVEIPATESSTLNDVTVTNNGDGSININGTASADTSFRIDQPNWADGNFKTYYAHKYLITINTDTIYYGVMQNTTWAQQIPLTVDKARIVAPSVVRDSCFILIRVTSGSSFSNVKVVPQLFDLTQMFGSTIADYIYSLEQANAGAGVAYFRKLFPKPYYAYNAGELMSVKTSAHNMTGFNQCIDFGNTGYYTQYSIMVNAKLNRLMPNTEYCLTFTTDKPVSVSVNEIYPTTFTYKACASAGTYSVTFTTKNDLASINQYYGETGPLLKCHSNNLTSSVTFSNVCLNLSWDGSRNGEYEPYELHNYPLDADLELRGIPKLDANNALYYDGDIYEADGTVTRKYGIVDLGTVDYVYDSINDAFRLDMVNQIPLINTANVNINYLCLKYKSLTPNWSSSYPVTDYDYCCWRHLNNSSIFFNNSNYSDAAIFKTAMSGVYLVYELATPTTETADPYAVTQIVNDFGTEEYVDTRDVAVPVGHETFYQINLKSKLEMAPNSPSDGDGDYIVRQTDGMNAYVPLVIPNELPDAPSTDGSYQLTVTVTDGEPTYSWEAAE